MWGALITGGLQVASGLMGMKSADQQQQLAMQEFYANQEQRRKDNNYRDMMMLQGVDAQERENEMFDYYMGINDQNQALVLDQLGYSRDWVQQNRDFLLAEQEYEKYRISDADKNAAKERERQLQKLIDDEEVSKAERQRALEELDYVRSIAQGEREYDVRQYENDQLQSQLEYQYRMQEYERMMGIANDERQFVIDRQEKILTEAGIIGDEIDRVMAQFGDYTPPKRYTEADVERSNSQFLSDYMADADRAAEKIASVNEAGLIRSGVDMSSTGDSSRRELLREQINPLYHQARIQARNDAMGYITGLQNNEINAAQADLAARSGVMDEIMKREGMTLNTMMGLRDPTSARINDYLSMGTGVLSPRNLTSAGSYSAPLDIRSAILDRSLAGIAELGMASAMGTSTSAAGANPSSYDGQFTPQFPGMTDPSSYYGSARPNAPDNFFRPLGAGAVDAASSGYENIATGFSNLFQTGNEWWNNRNTSNDLDDLFSSNPSVYG
jgi:hypothetical protein